MVKQVIGFMEQGEPSPDEGQGGIDIDAPTFAAHHMNAPDPFGHGFVLKLHIKSGFFFIYL